MLFDCKCNLEVQNVSIGDLLSLDSKSRGIVITAKVNQVLQLNHVVLDALLLTMYVWPA